MSETTDEPRDFFVDKQHLDDCDKALDLGDGRSCRVVYYPHKDDLHRLLRVIEHSAYQAAQERIKELEAENARLNEDARSMGTIGVMYGAEQVNDRVRELEAKLELASVALWKALGAAGYAYADSGDQYYQNAMGDINLALKQIKQIGEGKG